MDKSIQIHQAFEEGDLDTLNKLTGNIPGFPNCLLTGFGHCLEYAIYHSPIFLIETLLEMGCDPNYGEHAGFPSVIAALSTERDDKTIIIDLLLKHGVDINQHGVNDWTPLHYAAANNDIELIQYLLEKGADPNARTRIDDYATPLEEAEILGRQEAVKVLRKFTE